MFSLLNAVVLLFGIFLIIGGLMGFRAGSKASLIAGGISGVLLLVAGALIYLGSVTAGVIVALVVSILLLGKFLPAFLKTKKLMPAGISSAFALVTIVLCVLFFF